MAAMVLMVRSPRAEVMLAAQALAGGVGTPRGVTQNLAAAVGTAMVGAIVVGLLSSINVVSAASNSVISVELKAQTDSTNLNFIWDSQVEGRLGAVAATSEELTEALIISAGAWIWAIKVGFLWMSWLALLANIPCSWLPD